MTTSSGETSPLSMTPSPLSSVPKYGTLIPNRVFVGGIPANTQENELKLFFSTYGAVKDCKIINDRAGVSKGYGFVTFECQEDAEKVIKKEADNLIFKDRKLNIGPAVRKQQAFPRIETSPGAVFFSPGTGVPYTYHNGMAVFDYPHLAAQPQQAAYPVVPQQTMYMSPYTVQSPPAATPASWTTAAAQATTPLRWAPQSPGAAVGPYMYPIQTTEMMYAQQAAAHTQLYTTDVSDVEATAAAAEGSMVLEPNMARQFVEVPVSTHQHQHHQQYPTIPQQKSGPIVYGKRPGSAIVSPPSKLFGAPQTSVTYSPGSTSSIPAGMQVKAIPRMITKTVNGTPINVIFSNNKVRTIESIPLTPPPTPEMHNGTNC